MTIYSGLVIYFLLAFFLYLFWRRMRGLSFGEMLDRSADAHHHVQRVIDKHPHGGRWKKHCKWMEEERDAHD